MSGGMGDGLVPGGEPPEQGSLGDGFRPDPETDSRAGPVPAKLLALTLVLGIIAVGLIAVGYLVG